HEPGGTTYRAWHRRTEPFSAPPCGGTDPVPDRRARAADRYGIRPVRQPRTRCTYLRLLSGCTLPADFDAVRPDARAGGRTTPVGEHAADRDGLRPAREFRARARRRARDPVPSRARPYAGAGRFGCLAAAFDPSIG